MPKSVGIFYFSGTGNTEVVAELLAKAFEQLGAHVETTRIEHVLQGKARFNPEAFDLIGIGHPIHGLDVPRIVYDFVDALPQVAHKRAFIFKTAADFISVNNGASKTAIKRLRRKGYDVFYDRIVCMPSNWALRYDDTFSKQGYRPHSAENGKVVDIKSWHKPAVCCVLCGHRQRSGVGRVNQTPNRRPSSGACG